MTERVTVTTPRGCAGRVPRRRPPGAWTGPGTGRARSLIRAQARLALGTCAVVALVTGGLPVLFACDTGLSRIRLLGVRLPWLILCAAVPLLWVAVARRHVRLAERADREFTARDIAARGVADDGLAGHGRTVRGPAPAGFPEPGPPARGYAGQGPSGRGFAEQGPADTARSG